MLNIRPSSTCCYLLSTKGVASQNSLGLITLCQKHQFLLSLTSLFLVFSASPYNAALFLPPLLPFLRTDHSSELQQKDSSLKTLPGHMGKA